MPRFPLLASMWLLLLASVALPAQTSTPFAIDKAGEKWVETTLETMTLDQKLGQMLASSFYSTYLSTDSAEFQALERDVDEYHVGGFHVFGGTEPAPAVLLNPTYGTVTLGQPL